MLNLNPLDIIRRIYTDGFVSTGMIVGVTMICGAPMYNVMFETVDNGVELRQYSAMSLYDYRRI